MSRVRENAKKRVRGGVSAYSLDRSQDQTEEVEAEGDLPKDKKLM